MATLINPKRVNENAKEKALREQIQREREQEKREHEHHVQFYDQKNDRKIESTQQSSSRSLVNPKEIAKLDEEMYAKKLQKIVQHIEQSKPKVTPIKPPLTLFFKNRSKNTRPGDTGRGL